MHLHILALLCFFAVATQAALTRIPGITNQARPWSHWNGQHVGQDLPGCDTYHLNQCSGNNIITPPEFEAHRWYTPMKGDPDYQESFQSYGVLTGYAHIQYTSTARTSATVTIFALHKDNSTQLTYIFDGVSSTNNIKTYDSSYTKVLQVEIQGADGSSITLEAIDFYWNTALKYPINHNSGDYRNGQKGAIVEMFGWPHADIAQECQAMSKAGYLGVKVFPPQEQIMSNQPFNNILNPWYFMYQPVSYRLSGRMGTRDDLRNMIAICRGYNVRVYADAVINHMVGGGNDANPYHRSGGNAPHCNTFPQKNSSLPGGSSPMYTQSFTYTTSPRTGLSASQEFPANGYGPQDFHCERALNSWTDPLDLNAGWLTGLVDLNTEVDFVRERIAAYLTDLLSIGFSGFRIDAAKHMKPDDLVAILTKFQRNLGGALPDDFITWMEILLGGESDMLMCNVNSGYNYGGYLYNALLAAGISKTDAEKIKIWNSGYPKEPEKGTCTISKTRSAIQNDDADQQNQGSSSRDMGNTGCVLVTGGCNSVDEHRSFEEELFNNPPGADNNSNDYPIRMILSSYWFPNLSALGIPDGKSDCSKCTITCEGCHSVPYVQAYKADSTGYDGSFGHVDYTRVHRDASIIAAMRKWIGLSAMEESKPIVSEY